MVDCYENTPLRPGMEAIYVSLRSPPRDDDVESSREEERTRLRISQTPRTPLAVPGSGGVSTMERSASVESDASRKRRREPVEGEVVGNGDHPFEKRSKMEIPGPEKTEEEAMRVRNGDAQNENGKIEADEENVSEEGELDE